MCRMRALPASGGTPRSNSGSASPPSVTSTSAAGCQPLAAEFVDFAVIERRQLFFAHHPAQQQVGQCRIAGQHRTMEVGAEYVAAHHTFGTVAATVADAAHHASEGIG